MSDPRPAILIVEDEAIVALDLQQTLEALGYDAYATAASSTEAIEHAAQRCPDVVLMDVRIQGDNDGIETATLMQDSFGAAVVYLTAHSDATTLSRAARTGPYGYLVKPVTTDALRTTLEVALHQLRAAQARRRREEWLATAMDQVDDAVVSVDPEGRVTYLNAAAAALGDHRPTEALGRRLTEVLAFLPGDPVVALARPDAPPLQSTTHHVHVKGHPRVLQQTIAPLRAGAELVGATLVLRDLTALPTPNEQQLTRIAQGIAHEVNNPLTAVMSNARFGLAQLRELQGTAHGASGDETAWAELRTCLEDVIAGADRIRNVVADLSDFGGILRGDGSTDVTAAIVDAVEGVRSELLDRTPLHLDLTPNLAVTVPRVRMVRVVEELLRNAVQAQPSGPPASGPPHRITVTSRHGAEPHGITITVVDNGIGMTDDIRRRAFEPFFTTRTHGEGRGMGLSVAQGIVQAAGGRITLRSAPGAGATVTLELPEHPRTEGATVGAERPPPRVLVLEDAPMIRTRLRAMLPDASLHEVETGAEALAAIDRGTAFEAFVFDVHVHDMKPEALYEALLERCPQLLGHAVMLTSGATTPEIEAFLRAVPNDVFRLPLDPEKIRPALGLPASSD